MCELHTDQDLGCLSRLGCLGSEKLVCLASVVSPPMWVVHVEPNATIVNAMHESVFTW
jgi:hypothetical protein